MQKSGKFFNQVPEVNRVNLYGQRFYRMTRMKPVFLTQRTRTWKNKSRMNFAFNRVPIAVKNRKETTPAAILGTKRADELIAAQNETQNNPIEYSRPILGRKYSTQSAVHCCEKCAAKSAILSVQTKNPATELATTQGCESDDGGGSCDANDVDGLRAATRKIRTMTFTNKVGMPKQLQLQPQVTATIVPPAAATVCLTDTTPSNVISPAVATEEPPPPVKETPYDMCSVLRYALQIMRSESTALVGNEINSTDSQKLMAVHKRLLSMAIWNNNEEIFDESYHDIDGEHDFGSEQEFSSSAQPDSVILNSCVFFANGKTLIAPPASALPMPPKQWILDQIANEK